MKRCLTSTPGRRGPRVRPLGTARWLIGLVLGRRVRQERGQALPLAAIGLLAMALAVLATANLGQAVQERIKLQNTADSAAYSLAAMEARTFNYIAFLNRAQIAHYNTAMVIQSYITWTGYQVARFAVMLEQMANLNKKFEDLHTKLKCGDQYCEGLRRSLEAMQRFVLKPLAELATVLISLSTTAHQAAGMLGHSLVEALQIFNKEVIWQAQLWRAAMMNMPLLSGAIALIEVNDPDIHKADARTQLSMAFNIGLNSWEYYQAFDKGAGVNPMLFSLLLDWQRVTAKGAYSVQSVQKAYESGKSSPEVDAYRVMTELCNATRFPKFVYNRSGSDKSSWFMTAIRARKLGQTRFVSQVAKSAKSPKIDALVLDAGGLNLANLSDVKAEHLVAQAKDQLWGEAKEKLGKIPAWKVAAGISGVEPTGANPGLGDDPHNHAAGFSLASADVAVGGMAAGLMALASARPTLEGTLGDAILAHHKNGVHYGYQAGKVHKIFDDAKSTATDAIVGTDMLAGLQGTANSILGDAQKLANLGGNLNGLFTDPLGTAADASADAVDAASDDDDGGLLDTLGGLGDQARDWLGGAKEQAGQVLVDKMRDLAQPIIDKVKSMVTSMAGKALGKMSLDNIYNSGATNKFTSVVGILRKLLASFKSVEETNFNNHDHRAGDNGPSSLSWPGFAPYFKFNANSDRTRDFNQPSTWIWVSKSHEAFQGKLSASEKSRSPWRFKFSWTSGWETAELDTTARGIHWPMMGEGLNAMARGMAYYHRPGNWHEHPNFFNPFWRARLAPIGQKLQSFWQRFVGGQLSDSADSMVAQRVLSGLQNAQMDLFTTFVSSIITH